MMVMGCWGAIRTGGGTRNWKQERLQEQRHKGKNGSGLECERQGQQTLSAKVKNRPSSAYWIYRPRGVLSGTHASRALNADEIFPH
jgi:hypothetical protein